MLQRFGLIPPSFPLVARFGVQSLNSRVVRLIGFRAAAAMMQMLTLLIIARSIPVELFGSYSAFVAVGSTASGVGGLGITTRVLRLQADNESPQALLYFFIGSGIAAISGFVVLTTAFLDMRILSMVAVAAALTVATEYLGGLVQNILFGEMRQKRAELLLASRRALVLIAVGSFAASSRDRVFSGLAVAALLSLVLSAVFLGQRNWPKWEFRGALKSSRPYWFTNIWTMVQQFDVVILKFTLGGSIAGGYGLAFRTASSVHIVTNSLVSIGLPQLSAETDSDIRQQSSKRLILTGVAYSIVIVALSPVAYILAPRVFGEGYSQYAWLFPLTMLLGAVNVVSQMLSTVLYAENLAATVARCTALGTLAGLVTTLTGGAAGYALLAVAGTLIGQVVLSAVMERAVSHTWRKASPALL